MVVVVVLCHLPKVVDGHVVTKGLMLGPLMSEARALNEVAAAQLAVT